MLNILNSDQVLIMFPNNDKIGIPNGMLREMLKKDISHLCIKNAKYRIAAGKIWFL